MGLAQALNLTLQAIAHGVSSYGNKSRHMPELFQANSNRMGRIHKCSVRSFQEGCTVASVKRPA